MPRGFTEQEREIIKARLLAKGQEAFAHGIRGSSVEELARAAGISKGAFYLFYTSKEELFFELLELTEARLRQAILRDLTRSILPPRERFARMLRRAVTNWKADPLLAGFDRTEYGLLLSQLPPEHVTAHLRSDEKFAGELIDTARQAGIKIDCEPRLLAGLVRALFFLSLHEEDFGADIYPEVLDAYVTMLTKRLVPKR